MIMRNNKMKKMKKDDHMEMMDDMEDMMEGEDKSEEKDDFEADDALETLMKADKIKSNKELMTRVHQKAGRKIKALTGLGKIKSIGDINKYRNKKFGPKTSKGDM